MPQSIYTVDLDGKRYRVSGDHPPTEDDIRALAAHHATPATVPPASLAEGYRSAAMNGQPEGATDAPVLAGLKTGLSGLAHPSSMADMAGLLIPSEATAPLVRSLAGAAAKGTLRTTGAVGRGAVNQAPLIGAVAGGFGGSKFGVKGAIGGAMAGGVLGGRLKSMMLGAGPKAAAAATGVATDAKGLTRLVLTPEEVAREAQAIRAAKPAAQLHGMLNAAQMSPEVKRNILLDLLNRFGH